MCHFNTVRLSGVEAFTIRKTLIDRQVFFFSQKRNNPIVKNKKTAQKAAFSNLLF